jgi:hypothetical protein
MATFDRKLLKGLWDVTYEFPMFGIRTTIRVRAEDEDDAHGFTVDFFNCIGGGPTTCAKPASRQPRKIYEETEEGAAWRWKPRQKTKKCSCRERRIERTRTDIDIQQNIHPQHFIRQEGKKPLQGETRAAFYVPPSEVAEAFGPPQIDKKILFWNFATRDGKIAFSLFTKPRRKSVGLVARGKLSTPYLWTSDRLVSIGDEPPLALSGAC